MLNRLLTPKEQWLLIGFGTAMLLGAGALWLNHSNSLRDSALGALTPAGSGEHAPLPLPDAPTSAPPEQHPPTIMLSTAEPLAVAAMGAVRWEGLYTLPPDARVRDLLDAAGGAEDGGFMEPINRAARLLDGTTLTVPWADYTDAEGEAAQYKRWVAGVYLNPPEYLHQPWAEQVRAQYAPLPPPGTAKTGGVYATMAKSGAAGGCINLNTATRADLETLPGIGPVIAQRILDYRDRHGFNQLADLMNVPGIAEKRFEAIGHLVCL